MAIMTRSGRAALADAIRQRPLHLAWGTGNTAWDSTAPQGTLTFGANDVLQLPHAYVSGVALAAADGTTPYSVGTDYTVDNSTGRVTRSVTGGIPAEATVRVDYTIDTPPPDVTQTSLLGELGRRAVDEVAFVVADDAGAIVAPTGRFTLSATPTNHLFVRVRFEFEDAPDAVTRQRCRRKGRLSMGLPQRALYTIHETAARWGCTVYDIAGWAGIGTLKIVTGIPPVACGDQRAGGLVEIQAMDIVPIFRNCGTGPQTAQLLRVRPLDSDEWLHIDEPESGVTVSVGDVMILGEDVRRFEETHDLFGRIEEGAGLGDDGDYDWAAMRIEITRRVYEQGLPASQAAWVRELQDWFSDRSVDGSFPDERSIRRRLRPVLIALKFKAKTS